jgi:hypothetical protein
MGRATHGGQTAGPRGLGAAASAVAPALRAVLIAAVAYLLVGGSPARAAAVEKREVATVWKELTDAMGGQESWDRLPYLRFDFVVERDGKEVARFRHWWDRAHGRCRVEGPDEKGRVVTAIFNLANRKGKSFTDGMSDTDSANVAGILENGYERWVNDTYWLMMPFKLKDPGAHLVYGKSAKTVKGTESTAYDVLELTFNPGVGLTPKDHYWLFVNRGTHLIDRWEMVLQGQKPPPSAFTWERWTSVGPIRLSLERRMVGKNTIIRFDNVGAPASMDESVFTDAHPKG